jgi:hypothetical protein
VGAYHRNIHGFSRTGNNVESAMAHGLQAAVKLGYVKIENERVFIV